MYFEEKTLPLPLTEEQKAARRERNSEIDLEVVRAGEALDRAKATHKSATEKIKGEKKRILSELRQGYVETNVKVAEYVDEEKGVMIFSDEQGDEVYRRELTIGEKRELQIPFNIR